MKKRLRKKRRLREFREDCFELTFEIDPSLNDDQVDSLTDAFIEMIEANHLQFGGGGGTHAWSGVVQGPWRRSATPVDRDTVLDWLNKQPHVNRADAGPLRDGWYGWD